MAEWGFKKIIALKINALFENIYIYISLGNDTTCENFLK
jgi:hypothetical protein